MTDEERLWRTELAIIDGRLDLWNLNIIPRMEKRGDGFKRFAHAEARRLGWRYCAEKHAYVPAVQYSDAEYATVMGNLAKQEIKRWLKERPGRMVPTHVKGVMACWDISKFDDTGLLILWDGRKGAHREHIWNDVPEELYKRLFTRQAKITLAQIMTIFAGKELDGPDVMRLIHDRETEIAHVG